MDIIISNTSSTPIYEQITSQVKAQVMDGTLKPGDSIPSMRALAKSLHISVITVQRAYEDLQKDGFIETAVGKRKLYFRRRFRLLAGRAATSGGRSSGEGR